MLFSLKGNARDFFESNISIHVPFNSFSNQLNDAFHQRHCSCLIRQPSELITKDYREKTEIYVMKGMTRVPPGPYGNLFCKLPNAVVRV